VYKRGTLLLFIKRLKMGLGKKGRILGNRWKGKELKTLGSECQQAQRWKKKKGK
jgi:hypothetical protein